MATGAMCVTSFGHNQTQPTQAKPFCSLNIYRPNFSPQYVICLCWLCPIVITTLIRSKCSCAENALHVQMLQILLLRASLTVLHMSAAEDEVIIDEQPKPRRGLKPGQRHAGSFARGFDPKRRGYFYDGKSFAQMAQEEAPECLDLWVRARDDENVAWPIRLRASELIVERAYGKAASVIDMQVIHTRPLSTMSDDELLRIATEPVQALTFDADQMDQFAGELAVPLAVEGQNTEDCQ
jgi:hypothetical protein